MTTLGGHKMYPQPGLLMYVQCKLVRQQNLGHVVRQQPCSASCLHDCRCSQDTRKSGNKHVMQQVKHTWASSLAGQVRPSIVTAMSCNNRHTSPLFSHHLQPSQMLHLSVSSVSDLLSLCLLCVAYSQSAQSKVMVQCRCGKPPQPDHSYRCDGALSAIWSSIGT